MTQPRLALTLLGTFRVAVDDVAIDGFATDKVRALLAYLAVEAGLPHARPQLAALLWPDMPEAIALRNLRKTLHRLDQALAPFLDTTERVVVATRQTIQFNPDAGTVDAGTFSSLLETSAGHPHRSLHLCPPCLERLGSAVRLYRGELLVGFGLPDADPFEEWLLIKREALLHRVLQTLYKLADAHLQRDEYDQAYTYAMRQVELDPGREEAHRQVLRALDLSGQRSEALAFFERCRQTLWDTLGVEPAAETMALADQLAAGSLDGAGLPSGDTRRMAQARHHDLPVQLTPFIGRADELVQIEEYLRDDACRLVTILGPGGVGKTRLAIAAAEKAARHHRFVDGIVFFSLAEVDSEDKLPGALAAGLGLDLDQGRDTRAQLLAYLTPKKCLLVLDNLEQLLAGVDVLVDMLTAAPGICVLATSRLPLGLRAEHRIVLTGLDYLSPDEVAAAGTDIAGSSSVRLFTQAAQRVQPGFALNASNERDVVRLCQLVDGMPLALELAAPWVRVMDCAMIADALDQNLALLTTAAPDVPDRHRSMEAVFSQSWHLLAQHERTVLSQLSVFRGPFDLEAAVSVVGATALDLASFVDTSLVQRTDAGLYQLHPLLRQYAARMLASSPADEESVHDRHGRHYLDLLAGQEPALHGPDPREAIDVLQRQIANLQQAWERAADHRRYEDLTASLTAMVRLCDLTSLLDTPGGKLGAAVDRLRRRLEAEPPAPQSGALLIRLLVWQAHVHDVRHQIDDAVQAAETALALAERAGDCDGEARARRMLGEVLPQRGDFDHALLHMQQAHDYFQSHDLQSLLGSALASLGGLYWGTGDLRQAAEHVDRARDVQQALGDRWGLANACCVRAGIAYEQGDLDVSRTYALEALRIYEAIGNRWTISAVRGNLALVCRRLGQFDLALQHNQVDLATCQELGDRHGAAVALANRGAIYKDSGNLDQALLCYQQALQIEEDDGSAWDAAGHRVSMAQICRLRGEDTLALTYYVRALAVLRTNRGTIYAVGPFLEAAELQLDLGDLTAARDLTREAADMAAKLGAEDLMQRSEALAARITAASGTAARR